MLGAGAVKPTDTADERAKNIFNRCVTDGETDGRTRRKEKHGRRTDGHMKDEGRMDGLCIDR